MTTAADPLSKPLSLGIRGRLILWFVLGAVGAVFFGGIVVYISGLSTIQGTLGQTYCQIASRVVGQFESRVRTETAFIQGIATDVLTTEVAMEAFEIYDGRPAPWLQVRNDRLTKEWRDAAARVGGSSQLHPQLSHRLAILARLKEGLVGALFVVDLHGAIIAASNPPQDRVIGDLSWYRALTQKSDHFVYVDLDRQAGALTVAAPVWGGINIVGYVVGSYRFDQLVDVIDGVRFGNTGEAVLVDYAGVPLSGRGQPLLVQALAERPEAGITSQQNVADGNSPYWVTLSDDRGPFFWQRLVCIARTLAINGLRDRFQLPPWAVVVTQAPVESYAVLRNSLGFFALAGAVGVVIVGLGGAFIAWHITTPLQQLQEGVRRFARGVRDRAVEVSTSDEIGELAAEFNRMAARVSASESELRAFARAVEDAADAMVLMEPDGRIYYVNPSFETVTGYGTGAVHGESLSLLDAGAALDHTSRSRWNELRDAIGGELTWRGEVLARRANGDMFPIDVSISPIHGENGDVVALVAIFRDITLAREYQQSLESEVEARTREIAETQGLTAMGRMASMIAHDLRNALSTVKMNLQILFRRSSESDDGSRESCEMGLEQVRYMEEILRDMLSYARPDRLQSDWHDITPIIDETLAAFDHRIREHGISVTRDDAQALPKIYGDRVKVMAVLRNLVDNAIEAMSDGGTLNVSTHMVLSEDPTVQIVISDTGVGISEDTLADVFEPFFTTRTKGTGLGLAIVKRIVDQHGGDVSIESKEGAGTRVTFHLPTVSAE